MFIGQIAKASGSLWSAECEIIGAFTQGKSRKDSLVMLADCIEAKVDHAGFKATAREIGPIKAGVFAVFIDSSDPALLAAEVLKYQRWKNKLSLADVAKALHASSRNAYASYEQGKREPSLSKLRELLAVVAPDMAVIVGPRAPSKTKRRLAR
jgi:DNA-binding XRE family transcriptional regulator